MPDSSYLILCEGNEACTLEEPEEASVVVGRVDLKGMHCECGASSGLLVCRRWICFCSNHVFDEHVQPGAEQTGVFQVNTEYEGNCRFM